MYIFHYIYINNYFLNINKYHSMKTELITNCNK